MASDYARKFMGIGGPAAASENSGKGKGFASPQAEGSKHADGEKGPSAAGLIGKIRRWNITNDSEDCEPEDDVQQARKGTPKTPETFKVLVDALKDHYLFAQLSFEDLEQLITAMAKLQKQQGETIIKQGQKGTEFFVLEKGAADVFINDVKVTSYVPPSCFGDLALIYNAKRAATIVATLPCTLWTLDLRSFRRLLAATSSAQSMARVEFLRKVPLLKNLTPEQVSKLAGALSSKTHAAHDVIIRQGEPGDVFYLLKSGIVKCTQVKQGREIDLMTLHAGEYFGEMALLLNEPRHANVIAVGPVEVLALQKADFTKLLGPAREVLNRQMRIRVLRSVPLLANLTDKDLETLGDAMRCQTHDAGHYIIREGEPGTRFYIINEGTVRCCKRNADGKEEEILRLQDQDYFGERALLKEEPRAASVIAVSRVEVLSLERSEFNSLLGDLETIMNKEVQRREDIKGPAKGGPTVQAAIGAAPRTQIMRYKLEELQILRTLGAGTFGRVKLIMHKPTNIAGAMKCMQKAQVIACHQEKNILNEKNVLVECQHPLILQLLGTSADQHQIYMIMELIQGGELWAYIYQRMDILPRTKQGGFRKPETQFYAGCVISAIEYIHSKGVAYRDLKPENILMDSAGYVKIVDFGFAKHIPYERSGSLHVKSFTLCGTPEYLSPELVLSRGHDKSVDYWAYGCLVYELLIGYTPFQDDVQGEIFKKIINSVKCTNFPRSFDAEATDLIKKLLCPNPAFRLGNLIGGPKEIREHPFFNGLDWDKLHHKKLPAPFVPAIKDSADVSHFNPYPDDEVVTPYHGPQHYFEQF